MTNRRQAAALLKSISACRYHPTLFLSEQRRASLPLQYMRIARFVLDGHASCGNSAGVFFFTDAKANRATFDFRRNKFRLWIFSTALRDLYDCVIGAAC